MEDKMDKRILFPFIGSLSFTSAVLSNQLTTDTKKMITTILNEEKEKLRLEITQFYEKMMVSFREELKIKFEALKETLKEELQRQLEMEISKIEKSILDIDQKGVVEVIHLK